VHRVLDHALRLARRIGEPEHADDRPLLEQLGRADVDLDAAAVRRPHRDGPFRRLHRSENLRCELLPRLRGVLGLDDLTDPLAAHVAELADGGHVEPTDDTVPVEDVGRHRQPGDRGRQVGRNPLQLLLDAGLGQHPRPPRRDVRIDACAS
jgi:hypothetical protein